MSVKLLYEEGMVTSSISQLINIRVEFKPSLSDSKACVLDTVPCGLAIRVKVQSLPQARAEERDSLVQSGDCPWCWLLSLTGLSMKKHLFLLNLGKTSF